MKNFYINQNLLKKLFLNSLNLNKDIKTFSRNSLIIPKLIGLSFKVYNGKQFIKVKITENMIGHKLGEFSSTRVKNIYKK